MMARKGGEPAPPVIRHAPLGELKVYTIYEHELDSLAQGSPTSLLLNFALLLLPTSLSLFANWCSPLCRKAAFFRPSSVSALCR